MVIDAHARAVDELNTTKSKLADCEDRHSMARIYRLNQTVNQLDHSIAIYYLDHTADHDMAERMKDLMSGLKWEAKTQLVLPTEITPRDKHMPRLMIVAGDNDMLYCLKPDFEQLFRTKMHPVLNETYGFKKAAIIIHPRLTSDPDINFPEWNIRHEL